MKVASSGFLNHFSQQKSQIEPVAPTSTKPVRQPNCCTAQATTIAPTAGPAYDPLLSMAAAMPRSFAGIHSRMTLAPEGYEDASPAPMTSRVTRIVPKLQAKPVATVARENIAMPAALT
jgi:hypothetical protein